MTLHRVTAGALVLTPASGGPEKLRGMYRDFPDGGLTGDACELLVGLPGFHADLDATTR